MTLHFHNLTFWILSWHYCSFYSIKSCQEIAMKYKFKENKQRCKIFNIFILYMADDIKFLRYFACIEYI